MLNNRYLLLAAALTFSTATNADEGDPMAKLAWLVGEWEFADSEKAGDYREAGTRSCEYIFDGAYIQCHSDGTSHTGKQREYYFLFNYNRHNARYEMVSINETYPGKILYIVTPFEQGQGFKVTYGVWEKDGVISFGEEGATVTYNGEDQYTWESANFKDTATRKQ